MIETITWIIAIAALVGVWLNIKKDRRSFMIWACTNGYWAIYDGYYGLYAQASLFAVYFVLAIVGLFKWK